MLFLSTTTLGSSTGGGGAYPDNNTDTVGPVRSVRSGLLVTFVRLRQACQVSAVYRPPGTVPVVFHFVRSTVLVPCFICHQSPVVRRRLHGWLPGPGQGASSSGTDQTVGPLALLVQTRRQTADPSDQLVVVRPVQPAQLATCQLVLLVVPCFRRRRPVPVLVPSLSSFPCFAPTSGTACPGFASSARPSSFDRLSDPVICPVLSLSSSSDLSVQASSSDSVLSSSVPSVLCHPVPSTVRTLTSVNRHRRPVVLSDCLSIHPSIRLCLVCLSVLSVLSV